MDGSLLLFLIFRSFLSVIFDLATTSMSGWVAFFKRRRRRRHCCCHCAYAHIYEYFIMNFSTSTNCHCFSSLLNILCCFFFGVECHRANEESNHNKLVNLFA